MSFWWICFVSQFFGKCVQKGKFYPAHQPSGNAATGTGNPSPTKNFSFSIKLTTKVC